MNAAAKRGMHTAFKPHAHQSCVPPCRVSKTHGAVHCAAKRGCVQFDEPISKPVVVLDRSVGLTSLTRILSGDFSTHDYP